LEYGFAIHAKRFLTVALLADFALFIPFFLRAGAPRFAFLDFFATFNLPIGSSLFLILAAYRLITRRVALKKATVVASWK
jgi:hypothetical protein